MLPSIGRIVHYTNLGDKDGKYPPEVQAALITGVYKCKPRTANDEHALPQDLVESANKVGDSTEAQCVDLTIFYRTGYFQMQKVPFSMAPERGHWNWPPRV